MKTKLLKKIRRKYEIKKCGYRLQGGSDRLFHQWEVRTLKSKRRVNVCVRHDCCLKEVLIGLLYWKMPTLRLCEARYYDGSADGWIKHIPWMNEKNKKWAIYVLYIYSLYRPEHYEKIYEI